MKNFYKKFISFKPLIILIILMFLPFLAGAQDYISDDIKPDEKVTQEVEKKLNIISKKNNEYNLENEIAFQIPLVLEKKIGNTVFKIGLFNKSEIKNSKKLTAYAGIEFLFGGKSKKLYFKGDLDNNLDENGNLKTTQKIFLATNFNFNLGFGVLVIEKGETKTFLEFDCSGVKNFGFAGKIHFDPKKIKNAEEDAKIIVEFEIAGKDFNDFVLDNLTIPEFEIPGISGLSFTVKNMKIDFSDNRNAEGMKFPKDYFASSEDNLWKGVYFENVKIKLPQKLLGQKNQDKGLEIEGNDMIIDQLGFTGNVSVNNIMAIADNSKDRKWPFTINNLELGFQKNELMKGKMSGILNFKLRDKMDTFPYIAEIKTNAKKKLDFYFKVDFVGDNPLEIPINELQAKLVLLKGSAIVAESNDDDINFSANLNGRVNFDFKTQGLKIRNVGFRELELSTKEPYFKPGFWSGAIGTDSCDLSKFPISIEKFEFTTSEENIKFILSLHVQVVKAPTAGKEKSGFSLMAGTTVTFNTTYDNKGWYLKDVFLNELSVKYAGAGFELKGNIVQYVNDAKFGNGFGGAIELKVNTPTVIVQAEAKFGRVKNFDYFYVYGVLKIKNGIPITPGLNIVGGGFGVSYHMKSSFDLPDFASTNLEPIDIIGKKVEYDPNSEIGLGLRAMIIVASTDGNGFNADGTLMFEFFEAGGISKIVFDLNAGMMHPLDKPISEAPITGRALFIFDFYNASIDGLVDIRVNLDLIKGAGKMRMHFSEKKWFVYVGTPQNRVGVNINLAIFNLNAGLYLMTGSIIPDMPPPPSEVTNILSSMKSTRDPGLAANGGGIIVGANFNAELDTRAFIFYANLKTKIGFDAMIKEFKDATCRGESEPVGVNGWYMEAQVYAYLMAKAGIYIDLEFVKGDFEIFRLELAAALRAGLPNPIYFKGAVGGEFAVLGGLIRGKAEIPFIIGKECEIVTKGALEGVNINIISDLKPIDKEKEVSIFTYPQIILNLAEGMDFNSDKGGKYRPKLFEFSIMNGKSVIENTFKWSSDRTIATIETKDILPGNVELSVKAVAGWEKYENGKWIVAIKDGKRFEEVREITFKTGPMPSVIDKKNVAHQYPIEGQMYFLKHEYSNGYIILKQGGFDYLFDKDGGKWKYVVEYIDLETKKGFEANFSGYNNTERELKFETKIIGLKQNTAYKLLLKRVPNETQVAETKVTTTATTTGSGLTIQQKALAGGFEGLKPKTLYETFFRTSKYLTFEEKMGAMEKDNNFYSAKIDSDNTIHSIISIQLKGEEGFDFYEENTLIEFIAITENIWLNSNLGINNLIYEQPFYNKQLMYNQEIRFGEKGMPLKAIYIDKPYLKSLKMEKSEIESGNTYDNLGSKSIFYLHYNLQFEARQDHKKMNYIASVIKYNNGIFKEEANKFLNKPFIAYLDGDYPAIAKYYLPGKAKTYSEYKLIFKWF